MTHSEIYNAYKLLYKKFGPQHWWPGETPFEVIVGAILTQNTNWSNVSKAINNLKEAGSLEARVIHQMHPDKLAVLIRPAGYYNVKAKRLKNFVSKFMQDFSGDISTLSGLSLEDARQWLLSINGVGLETADSILLYALDKPTFVIDAYTKRILLRHGMVEEDIDYSLLQELFMDDLEWDAALFNEYHALIVRTAKENCKKKPLCSECPLNGWGHTTPGEQ